MNGLVRLTYEAGGVVGHMSPCQLGKEKLGSNKNSHPTCFRPVSRQIYAIYPVQENKIISDESSSGNQTIISGLQIFLDHK